MRHPFGFSPSAVARLGFALLALAAPACGNHGTSNPTPAINDGAGKPSTAAPAAAGSSAQQGTPMTEIQTQLAREFSVSPADVKVRIIDRPKVPGLTVFSASIDPKKLGRNAGQNGVLDGTTILTERAAMARVARAWGYGAKRTVPAAEVAEVFGLLHSARDGVSAIVDPDTLDVFKSTAYPKEAAAAILPTEGTIDGLPAVTYCIMSGARSIPFTVVTALFKADGSVELRTQPVPKD